MKKQTKPDKFLIYQWVSPYKKTTLLYRGTRDGFGNDDFHSRCFNKGKLLTIAKSNHGMVFGGYTGLAWNNPLNTDSYSDGSCFLFSVTNKTKHAPF